MFFVLVILFFLACREKRNETVKDTPDTIKHIPALPECDTSFIILTFSDSIHGKLKNGLLAFLIRGVEENIISIFDDTIRTYSLSNKDYICLERVRLYSKYYVSRVDTLRGIVYQKGVGYSYPFDIILSEHKSSIDLKLAFTD